MDEQHNGASGAPIPVYDRYDDWRPVVTLEMIDAWLDATSPFDEGGDEDESPGNGTTSSAHANTKGGKQKRRRKPVKDLDAYLKQHNIAVVSGPESSNPAWSQLYVLEVCPWNADHTNHSACVGQIAESDAWFARCLHDSCAGKGWSEFRDAVEGDGGDDEESGEKKQSAYSRTYEKLESKFFAASDDGAQTGANATRDDLDADEDSDIKHAFTVRFHSPEGETYARVPKGNDTEQHHVTMRIESKAFRQWLQFQALLEHEMLRDNDLRMMQSSYAADALYQGPVHEVHYRLCEYDGAIWHDLLDDAGRAVRIKNGGWKLISDPPTFFIRKKGGLALPTPQSPPLAKGQTAGQYLHKHLRKWLNVLPPQPKRDKDGKPTGETTDFDYVLAVCALVGMLRPNGPHPVINPRGEQGAAKSTFAQVFRRLIDPQNCR